MISGSPFHLSSLHRTIHANCGQNAHVQRNASINKLFHGIIDKHILPCESSSGAKFGGVAQ